MAEEEKAAGPGSAKRAKTVGIIACVAGILAALIAVIGMMFGETDLFYVLLVIGGVLVSLLGLRSVRRAGKAKV